jgi:hypothetical protein
MTNDETRMTNFRAITNHAPATLFAQRFASASFVIRSFPRSGLHAAGDHRRHVSPDPHHRHRCHQHLRRACGGQAAPCGGHHRDFTARQNLLQALDRQQTVRMELSAGAFGAGEEFSGMLQVRRVGEGEFRKPKRGEFWEFSPTGICEPIEVRLSGSAGQIEIGFDPLTACAKRKSIQVKG